MQRIEKQIKDVQPITRNVVVELACDLCGHKAPRPDEGNTSLDAGVWAEEYYGVDAVEISRTYGTNYGQDGGDKTIEQFDVCPACWETELKPFFASHDVQPTVRELSW